MDKLLYEYMNYVKKEGHLTAYASSVLKEFIKIKGYTQYEYDYLAKKLRF